MELRHLLHLIRQRLLLIVVLVVVALAAGYAVTPKQAVYETDTILFVGVPIQQQSGLFNTVVQAGQQLEAASLAALVPEPSIAEAAIQTAGVNRSAGQVIGETKASVISGTNLIRLTVKDTDPVTAQRLANAMSDQLVIKAKKVNPVSTTLNGTGPTVSPITVSEYAFFPEVPISDGLTRNMTLAGIFGLVVAISLVLLLDYLDVSVRSPDDLERQVGLPVLGVIPLLAGAQDSGDGLIGARKRWG
jgi:capsular polysaccharide biosynthesis protein